MKEAIKACVIDVKNSMGIQLQKFQLGPVIEHHIDMINIGNLFFEIVYMN